MLFCETTFFSKEANPDKRTGTDVYFMPLHLKGVRGKRTQRTVFSILRYHPETK